MLYKSAIRNKLRVLLVPLAALVMSCIGGLSEPPPIGSRAM